MPFDRFLCEWKEVEREKSESRYVWICTKKEKTTRETETKLFIFFFSLFFLWKSLCVLFFLHRSQRHKMKIGMKPTFWAHTHQLRKNEMWTFHIYPLYLDHVFASNAFNWIYSCSKPNCVDSFYPVIVFLYIWC